MTLEGSICSLFVVKVSCKIIDHSSSNTCTKDVGAEPTCYHWECPSDSLVTGGSASCRTVFVWLGEMTLVRDGDGPHYIFQYNMTVLESTTVGNFHGCSTIFDSLVCPIYRQAILLVKGIIRKSVLVPREVISGWS